MELVANVNSSEINTNEEDDEVIMPPGFRFHPTDEELVGFYLQRKVEKKLMRIEFIKQIDIYKYDPWDLPKGCVGEKEWYFFCIRGRKYRNSIRPNRVTGSGFWKATGIDKAIYGVTEPHHCIGLKKSLVYYRGSAGKGTKTDWMMHEFRLPPNSTIHNLQQAEVWTLCRIFKRIPSHKKYTPTLKDTESSSAANKPSSPTHHSTSKTFSSEQSENQRKQILTEQVVEYERNQLFLAQAPPTMSYPCFNGNPTIVEDVFANGSWDELGPMVQFAVDPSRVYDCT